MYNISIHSLRVEGDVCLSCKHFPVAISIHSLRVEGDTILNNSRRANADFNPLPPRGGRRDNFVRS